MDVLFNLIQIVGAFFLTLTIFTAACVLGMWLLAYNVKPLQIEETYFQSDGVQWTLDNKSHKTFVGEVFCDNPSNDRYDPRTGKPLLPDSRIVFEDATGHREVIADNSSGIGTGTTKTRLWRSSGVVPAGLKPGPVVVWKEIIYECFGSIIHTSIETKRFVFQKDNGTRSGL